MKYKRPQLPVSEINIVYPMNPEIVRHLTGLNKKSLYRNKASLIKDWITTEAPTQKEHQLKSHPFQRTDKLYLPKTKINLYIGSVRESSLRCM